MNILFIGNSFTGRNDLPGLLCAIAVSAPELKSSVTDSVLSNGASLRQHWNKGDAGEKIRQDRWDYVVLQEQSTLPIKNAARFHENVRLFDQEIKRHQAQTVLYLTWAREHAPETQEILTQSTLAIAQEIGAIIAPVGVVWREALKTRPDLSLYGKDGSHPSSLGSYLAACVFYATLFGASPIELAMPERLGIDLNEGRFVQETAWNVTAGFGKTP